MSACSVFYLQQNPKKEKAVMHMGHRTIRIARDGVCQWVNCTKVFNQINDGDRLIRINVSRIDFVIPLFKRTNTQQQQHC